MELLFWSAVWSLFNVDKIHKALIIVNSNFQALLKNQLQSVAGNYFVIYTVFRE